MPKLLPTNEAEVARLRGAAILVLQRRSSAEQIGDRVRKAKVVATDAVEGAAAVS